HLYMSSTQLLPYTSLFRSRTLLEVLELIKLRDAGELHIEIEVRPLLHVADHALRQRHIDDDLKIGILGFVRGQRRTEGLISFRQDRKSTRLNSSQSQISYA